MINLINYNNTNPCCCSQGMKFAICILKDLIDNVDLIDSYSFFYGCSDIADPTILYSRYPNFIVLQKQRVNDPTLMVSRHVCIDSINYIKIIPQADQSCKIKNELNKNYISPSVLILSCNENCCCKESAAAFMKDKYLQCNWSNQLFRVQLETPGYVVPNNPINNPDDEHYVSVIHMDYDVAWLFDQVDEVFYIVSLCKICSLVDISPIQES